MTSKLNLVISILFLTATPAFAQDALQQYEQHMIELQEGMRLAISDETRLSYHDSLKQTVREVLNTEGSLDYPFSLVTSMSILTSEDGDVRIFNWNMPFNDQTHTYACFIVWLEDEKNGIYNWIELEDTTDDHAPIENKYLTPEKWQGALYYEMIEVKKRRKREYFILLGWDGANGLTNRKVIEPLQITRGKVRLGAPVFDNVPQRKPKRYILEYSEEVSASLKFYEKDKRIVFDHLSPRAAGLEGNHAFYGPDLTFDAFVIQKGKLLFLSNIDITLDKEQSRRPYIDPRRQ